MSDERREAIGKVLDAHVARILMINSRGMCKHGCSAACATKPCEAWPSRPNAIAVAREHSADRILALMDTPEEPEPVAWGIFNGDEFRGCAVDRASAESSIRLRAFTHDEPLRAVPLFAHPPRAEGEVVEGWAELLDDGGWIFEPEASADRFVREHGRRARLIIEQED